MVTSAFPSRERNLYTSLHQTVLLETTQHLTTLLTPLSPRIETEISVWIGERGRVRISVEEYKERLFIYEVIIENQDYRRIKEEQSLRVEFGGFPWYVVGLLKRCCGGVGDKGGFGGGSRRRSRRSSGGGGGGGGCQEDQRR